MQASILVTGGAGFVGSHLLLALKDAGIKAVVLDDLSTGFESAVTGHTLVKGDYGDTALLDTLFSEHQFDTLIHIAASTVVPESVEKPLEYYDNNVVKTQKLLSVCQKHQLKHIIYSSSAAVYGDVPNEPITEDQIPNPINPYGRSKLICEWLVQDFCHASECRFVSLRYFNVAGADPKNRAGQSTKEATHLIKVAVQAALGKRDTLSVFGADYPTQDGTCVRDYIHVSDIANAHIAAFDYLASGGDSIILNCGYGHGFSVNDVIQCIEKITSQPLAVKRQARREGDAASVIANNRQILKTLEWQPQYNDLETIVKTALEWEKRL